MPNDPMQPAFPAFNGYCRCPMHTLFPQRISELVESTLLDLEAACALIGKDTYGQPHYTPDTIDPCNRVVQAFARHAVAAMLAEKERRDAQ
jgi:hypothetical protein